VSEVFVKDFSSVELDIDPHAGRRVLLHVSHKGLPYVTVHRLFHNEVQRAGPQPLAGELRGNNPKTRWVVRGFEVGSKGCQFVQVESENKLVELPRIHFRKRGQSGGSRNENPLPRRKTLSHDVETETDDPSAEPIV